MDKNLPKKPLPNKQKKTKQERKSTKNVTKQTMKNYSQLKFSLIILYLQDNLNKKSLRLMQGNNPNSESLIRKI